MLLVGAVTLSAEITINDIDKLVNDIKQERVGLTKREIMTAKDPFIYYKKGKLGRVLQFHQNSRRVKHYRFYITAIINDRAKINGRWYKVGNKVQGFRITNIDRNYIILSKNNSRMKVFMTRKNHKKIKLSVK